MSISTRQRRPSPSVISRRESEIREHLARHPYDFAIGSCHVGAGSPFRHERVVAWCAGKTLPDAVAPYFAEVEAAARSGLFDTLGHMDFVKRYVHPAFPPDAFAAVPEVYEPILRALIDSGTGLEINASGLRQLPQEPYPAPWVVSRFREMGGLLVTAGSDAHRIESFAFGLAHAQVVAAAAGFRELAFRRAPGRARACDRVAIPERLLEAVGQWS
jgi:histidinol-phosphatase (PHP family)